MAENARDPLPRGAVRWSYSVAELWADGAVHAVGIVAVLAASIGLSASTAGALPAGELAAVGVYLGTLAASIGISAAYNLWPVTPTKWMLRRFDHSAIYLLIAGTYTPFMVKLGTWWLLAAVWAAAAGGIGLKLLAPGRFDRLAIALYLLLGWSGVAVFRTAVAGLPETVVRLVVLGGVLYSAGVVFHVLDRRFCNAIWHGFVLVAAGAHFGAVAALTQAGA